jgi:hypothetical protein
MNESWVSVVIGLAVLPFATILPVQHRRAQLLRKLGHTYRWRLPWK